MGHATVRISDTAHEALRDLARREGKPMLALLDEAVEALRRKRFLDGVNVAYASLRGDPVAWEATLKERRSWDGTLLDGLQAREKAKGYRARSGVRRPGKKP